MRKLFDNANCEPQTWQSVVSLSLNKNLTSVRA